MPLKKGTSQKTIQTNIKKEIELKQNVIYHCAKEEYANDFLRRAKEIGWQWLGIPTAINNYQHYGCNTCYMCDVFGLLSYSNGVDNENCDFEVVEYTPELSRKEQLTEQLMNKILENIEWCIEYRYDCYSGMEYYIAPCTYIADDIKLTIKQFFDEMEELK